MAETCEKSISVDGAEQLNRKKGVDELPSSLGHCLCLQLIARQPFKSFPARRLPWFAFTSTPAPTPLPACLPKAQLAGAEGQHATPLPPGYHRWRDADSVPSPVCESRSLSPVGRKQGLGGVSGSASQSTRRRWQRAGRLHGVAPRCRGCCGLNHSGSRSAWMEAQLRPEEVGFRPGLDVCTLHHP